MGQYHLIVNLDQREFIHPHRLDVGLKACEQLCSIPGTPQALFILLLCSNGRGGGDLQPLDQAEPVVGRWSGDRIAVIGDYAKDDDMPGGYPLPGDERLSQVYDHCTAGLFDDITALVRPVLEAELGVEYYREADLWRVRRDPAASFSVLDSDEGGAS